MTGVRVLADSISTISRVRITTLGVTFPRFLLAEFNTHRMLSRNFASSRAIPTEKLLEMVREEPFVPNPFNQRVKGMGVGEPLEDGALYAAEARWREAAGEMTAAAHTLMSLGVDKSRANRLLEPFLYVTGIVTATEWDNFLALRDHPDAQPEFQALAAQVGEAIETSDPVELGLGDWHLPLLTVDERASLAAQQNGYIGRMKLVSAGRCARVSFWTHEQLEPQSKSIERGLRLARSGHLSPFEHVARPWHPGEHAALLERQIFERTRAIEAGEDVDPRFLDSMTFTANFRQWVQMRREFPNEDRFDRLIAEEAEAA